MGATRRSSSFGDTVARLSQPVESEPLAWVRDSRNARVSATPGGIMKSEEVARAAMKAHAHFDSKVLISTPVCDLILIGAVDLRRELFGNVLRRRFAPRWKTSRRGSVSMRIHLLARHASTDLLRHSRQWVMHAN